MAKPYILKHKNIPVITFFMDDEFHLKGDVEVLDKNRLPFGQKYADDKTSIIEELRKWIDNRGLPESRIDRFDIYKYNKVDNSRALMIGSYALNLSDHYMIHRLDKDIDWKKMNCFENVFSNSTNRLKIKDSVNPNLSINGALPKEWFIDSDGIRMLDKCGRNSTFEQEPFNEVIASEVMDIFGIDCVHYSLIRKDNDQPVSRCKCAVDKDTEIIPAAMVLNMEERKGRNNYVLFQDICNKNGIVDAGEYLDKMIFIDYLLGNNDRHLYNFGIIRNADSLQWLTCMPLFDNGNSLAYDKNIINGIKDIEDASCRWFPESNFSKLKYIKNINWFKYGNKDTIKNIVENSLGYNKKMSLEKINIVSEAVGYRIDKAEKIFRNLKSSAKAPVTQNV